MADLSDVLTAITNTLGSAFYPNGTSNPSAITAPVRVYPGWPVPASLDADLGAGVVNVSIYPLPQERVEGLTSPDAQAMPLRAALLTFAVSGSQITLGGSIQAGEVAMVAINDQPQTYAIQASDTLATVAAGIAAAIGGTASGNVVTVPIGTYRIQTGVSRPATVLQPMRRISRRMQITIWAPTPALRDQSAPLIDAALWNAERLNLPDGTVCGLSYQGSPMTDQLEKTRIYRRDVLIEARYLGAQIQNAPTVTSLAFDTATAGTPVVQFTVNQGS